MPIVMFYFCQSKNTSNIMKNIFNSISIYSWRKNSLLTNIRNKCVMKKIYIFWCHKNGQIFSSKVCHFQYITDSFLVEKWGTLERARRYIWKNLVDLDCQDSIRFGIFKLLIIEKSQGKSFSFPFSAKCFDRNFRCLF